MTESSGCAQLAKNSAHSSRAPTNHNRFVELIFANAKSLSSPIFRPHFRVPRVHDLSFTYGAAFDAFWVCISAIVLICGYSSNSDVSPNLQAREGAVMPTKEKVF